MPTRDYIVTRRRHARFATANAIPDLGELCIETDTGRRKMGDGVHAYNSLAYLGEASGTAFVPGFYFGHGHVARTAAAPVLNQLSLVPFSVRHRATLVKAAADCTTTVATAVLRVGVWADNLGVPGVLVTPDMPLSGSAATGLVESADIAIDLPPGDYWLGGVQQVATASWRCMSQGDGRVGRVTPSGSNVAAIAYTLDSVTGALANAPTITASTAAGTCPVVFLKANPT